MRKPTTNVAEEDQVVLLFDNSGDGGPSKQPEFVLHEPKLKSVFKMEHIFYIKFKHSIKCGELEEAGHIDAANKTAAALKASCPEYLYANFLTEDVWQRVFLPHYTRKVENMAKQRNNEKRGIYALCYDLLKGLIMEYTVNTLFKNSYYGVCTDGYSPVDTELYAQANWLPYKVDVKYVPGDYLRDSHNAVGTYTGWIPAGKLSTYKHPDTRKFHVINDGKETIDAETSALYNRVVREKMQVDYVMVCSVFEGRNVLYGVVNSNKYKNYALVTKYGNKFSDNSRSIVVAKGNFVRDLHNRFVANPGYELEVAARIMFP